MYRVQKLGDLSGVAPVEGIDAYERHGVVSYRCVRSGRRVQITCAVGRTTISFISTFAGCSIAYTIASATTLAGMAFL